MMSNDLILKTSCGACGSASDLYGSNCKHLTLCLRCGKTIVKEQKKCEECGVTITKLIREYNVRASVGSEKIFHIGRFTTGLPPFSKKKSADNKWSLQKEGLQGRQITDGLKDKYKNKPWILENETGQHQFQGQLEGAHSDVYYLLMMQGKEFVAIPAGSWYNFNKIAQYKQLTLEEAEEKMNKRKNHATGYERWMMKLATNGPAAFGETANLEGPSGRSANSIHLGNVKTEDDGDHSSRATEGGEETVSFKSKPGSTKFGSDDEEAASNPDLDLDDDCIEKGMVLLLILAVGFLLL
ncbi:hypothetical protein ZOSMA_29G01490 [Zostera marina]|uniref:Transcription initiation factor IIF subunit alpha n=1 Tax=Zostera marina TaxID=29655 RepID=A0A0K9PBZ1_ZOSMR|nr:hypothetical protein ZOSMA_29G01490 [Zostera marina]